MQISNLPSNPLKKERLYWLKISLVLSAIMVFCLWFNQKSIEVYWQQQYHQDSPLSYLQRYSWWRRSDDVRSAIGGCQQLKDYASKEDELIEEDTSIPSNLREAIAEELAHQAEDEANQPDTLDSANIGDTTQTDGERESESDETAQVANNEQLSIFKAKLLAAARPPEEVLEAVKKSRALSLTKVKLDADDYVVFLGDSMMQSFAPRMQRWLKKNYNIDSINMGRHSTGLTKQDYFDWPVKAESSLKKYKNLKLVVVFLGANDPWPIQRKRKLAFYSADWKKVYSHRMLRIVNAAHKQGAQVIWVGLPYMRIPKYSKKIVQIDELMKHTLKNKAIYVPIRSVLSGGKTVYRDRIKLGGKWRRVRQKDGIHMSDYGNATILNTIKPYLDIEPIKTAKSKSEPKSQKSQKLQAKLDKAAVSKNNAIK